MSDAAVEMKPLVIEGKGFTIPVDSLAIFKTIPAGKPIIIKAGKPTFTVLDKNVVTPGAPVILKEEIPQKIIPGSAGFDSPEIIPVEIKTVPCINPSASKSIDATQCGRLR